MIDKTNKQTPPPQAHVWGESSPKESLTHGQRYYDETGAVTVIGYPHSAQVEIERLNDELTCLSEALDAAQRKLSQMGSDCPECNGTGEIFCHADDCHDDLCALNGDEHSCSGKVEQCSCMSPYGDPIDVIRATMEERGLTNVDLYEIFGSKARVSEVMRRKRPLQVKHVRGLHRLLGIPYATLMQEYELQRVSPEGSDND